MKIHYSLLVSDLDGTLLTSDNRLTPRIKEQIDRFERRGGKFTIATGRSLMESRSFIEELNLRYPVILYNGAMLYFPKEEKTQLFKTLDRAIVERLFADIIELNAGFEFLLFSPLNIYAYHITEEKYERLAELGVHPIPITSLSQIEEELVKLQIIGSQRNGKALNSFVNHHPMKELCEIVQSHHYYFEIVPKGVSKGDALKKVSEILNVSIQETVTIGDQCNDISMLQIAGLPVAPSNAHPLVKKVAVHQVPTNDDEGVADLIEKVILR